MRRIRFVAPFVVCFGGGACEGSATRPPPAEPPAASVPTDAAVPDATMEIDHTWSLRVEADGCWLDVIRCPPDVNVRCNPPPPIPWTCPPDGVVGVRRYGDGRCMTLVSCDDPLDCPRDPVTCPPYPPFPSFR